MTECVHAGVQHKVWTLYTGLLYGPFPASIAVKFEYVRALYSHGSSVYSDHFSLV